MEEDLVFQKDKELEPQRHREENKELINWYFHQYSDSVTDFHQQVRSQATVSQVRCQLEL